MNLRLRGGYDAKGVIIGWRWALLVGFLLLWPCRELQAQSLATRYFEAARNVNFYGARGRHELALDLVQQARGDMPSLQSHPVWELMRASSLSALGRHTEGLAALDTLLEAAAPKFDWPAEFSSDFRQYLDTRETLLAAAHLLKARALFRLGQTDEAMAQSRLAESGLQLWWGDAGVQSALALELAALLAENGGGELSENLLAKVDRMQATLTASVAINPFIGVTRETTARLRDEFRFAADRVRGNYRLVTGDYAGAVVHLRRALEGPGVKLGPFNLAELQLRYRLMHALNQLGRHAEVPDLLPEAVYGKAADANRFSAVTEMVNARAEAGWALQALGRRSEALAQWQRLVDLVEQQRGYPGITAEQRQLQFAKWLPFYRWLGREYASAGNPARAFEQVELSKSRQLLETITQGNADGTDVLPADQRASLRKLTDELGALRNQILASTDPEVTARLQRRETSLQLDLQRLRQDLYGQFPRYAALSRIAPVELAGPELLPADTVFVSYALVPLDLKSPNWRRVQVLAFLLRGDRKAPEVVDLGLFTDLEGQSAQYLKELSTTNDQPNPPASAAQRPRIEFSSLARELSNRLLAPLIPKLGTARHLVISTDGALALVPMETLPLGDQVLVERFDISYVQSLSVLALLKQRQSVYEKLPRGSLFAMGAALYQPPSAAAVGDRTPGGAVAAGGLRSAYLRRAASKDAVATFYRRLQVALPELPGTEAEIKAVAALFPDSRVYLKEQATESKLLELNARDELAGFRYLLFAAHGHLNTEVPELSAVVLGQVNNPPGIDGFITAAKWPTYNIRSDLMVLSACQTGMGRIVHGEGVMGLPYALYVAGNKSTLLTLWEVDDEGSALFVKTFFGHVRAGRSEREAINLTKREFLRQGVFSSPFFWAAFVLYGN